MIISIMWCRNISNESTHNMHNWKLSLADVHRKCKSADNESTQRRTRLFVFKIILVLNSCIIILWQCVCVRYLKVDRVWEAVASSLQSRTDLWMNPKYFRHSEYIHNTTICVSFICNRMHLKCRKRYDCCTMNHIRMC